MAEYSRANTTRPKSFLQVNVNIPLLVIFFTLDLMVGLLTQGSVLLILFITPVSLLLGNNSLLTLKGVCKGWFKFQLLCK